MSSSGQGSSNTKIELSNSTSAVITSSGTNHVMEDQFDASGRKLHKLTYDIEACSSHSASYHPKNIMANKPQDQSSRWSSGSNNQMQFITLKLDNMALVRKKRKISRNHKKKYSKQLH